MREETVSPMPESTGLARSAAGLVVLLAALALIGSWVDWPMLRLWLPGIWAMKPNTALGLLLAASGLLLLEPRAGGRWRRSRTVGLRCLGASVLAIGLSTLLEHLLGRDFGIDAMLGILRAGANQPVGLRMAPNTASVLVLSGVALLAEPGPGAPPGVGRGRTWCFQWAALGVLVIGALSVIGYTGRVFFLSNLDPAGIHRMALNTTVATVALGLGFLASRPETGLYRRMMGDGPGAAVVRKLLIPLVLLPIVLSEIQRVAQDAGWVDPPTSTALRVVLMIGILIAALAYTARAIDRLDGVRREANDRLTHLQAVTAELSSAASVEQVADVVTQRAIRAMGASAGTVALFSEDRSELRVIRMQGMPEEIVKRYRRLAVADPLPIVRAAVSGEAVWISSIAQARQEYPTLGMISDLTFLEALVALPLAGNDGGIGAMTVLFDREKRFTPGEREFLLTLARQCGQAMQRARLYDAQVSALKTRNEFLSIASHELKTPMTALGLQLEFQRMVLKKEKSADGGVAFGRIADSLERSLLQVQKLGGLVDALLDVSRIQSGVLLLHPERVDLREIAREVAGRFKQVLEDAHCRLLLVAEDPVTGRWDKLRIEQVLMNLLSNAVKYAPGGEIRVEVSGSPERAFLSVTDDGPGIPREKHGAIFDQFERVLNRRTVSGLGLGLYICRQVARAHGGDIHVVSEPGKGASFVLQLPFEAQTVSVASS
jgi:signal transduction histidine kinase